MIIRNITTDDAEQYRNLVIRLDRETIYRLYEPGERDESIDAFKREIRSVLGNPRSAIIAAEINGRLVGYLAAYGKTARRINHVVTIAVAILQEYTGKGIGGKLFELIELEAEKKGITRLELTVMENNPNAIKLYKKIGFKEEGIKLNAMKFGDDYCNEIYMSKILNPPRYKEG